MFLAKQGVWYEIQFWTVRDAALAALACTVLSLGCCATSGLQEKGNANAHWWGRRCLAALSEGRSGGEWQQVGLRQLSGMLILVFARKVGLLQKLAGTGGVNMKHQRLRGVVQQRDLA